MLGGFFIPKKRIDINVNQKRIDMPPTHRLMKMSHIFTQGDDTPHSCKICLNTVSIANIIPDIMACPSCSDVFHTKCILSYIYHCKDTFSCPNCRSQYSTHIIDNPEHWNADKQLQNLLDDYDDEYTTDYYQKSTQAKMQQKINQIIKKKKTKRLKNKTLPFFD